jgi:hypothetical protein
MTSFENLEEYWDSANTVNHAWLPFNRYDDQGRELPPPERQPPPVMSQAYIEGLKISSDEIMASSGQFQADLGMQGNEKSGVAIEQRQRQGDNATYHYIDNLAIMIRCLGKALIDLIPKIYDTPRIIKIMAEDGVEHEVTIDPNAQQAYLQKQKEEMDTVESIFNPTVGRYDVEADVGPAFATRRQEAFNALQQIMKADPDLMKIAGDLLMKAADFPGADLLAERLKRAVPPQFLGDGPPPELQQAQQHIEQMTGMLAQSAQALAEEKKRTDLEAKQKQIDEYRAETDRLKLLLPLMPEVEQRRLVSEMVLAEHKTTMDMLSDSHQAELAHMAPPPEPANTEAA